MFFVANCVHRVSNIELPNILCFAIWQNTIPHRDMGSFLTSDNIKLKNDHTSKYQKNRRLLLSTWNIPMNLKKPKIWIEIQRWSDSKKKKKKKKKKLWNWVARYTVLYTVWKNENQCTHCHYIENISSNQFTAHLKQNHWFHRIFSLKP